MTEMTITEALAEIKTIGKRIQKKRDFIGQNVLRQEQLKDPLAEDGGSAEVIRRERQAILDLQERIIAIREAIAEANMAHSLTVSGATMRVSEWLVWRRDIGPGEQQFLNSINSHIQRIRGDQLKLGRRTLSEPSDAGPEDIIVNLDEVKLAARIEQIEEMLGTLDGLLSLHNATVTVQIAG